MFVQHVLAVLKTDGLARPSCRTASSSAAARRGTSARASSRTDRLEAVIGLASNLFSAPASRPASWCCAAPARVVPTARARCCSSTPTASSPQVGRRTSWTRSTSRRSSPPTRTTRTITGFARVVAVEELAENDFNLNIRRYVDNTPPPEPQDVRAHLHGGDARRGGQAHAADSPRTASSVAELFAPVRTSRATCVSRQSGWESPGVRNPGDDRGERDELSEAFDEWWDRHVKHIIELSGHGPRQGNGHSRATCWSLSFPR